ncbi:MAG: hypothetical protein JW993_12505, partial [Sedimentisphaerales bacterium]|nr:hypothetical protein [Sedimentisphaerales bacterium]
MHTKLSNLVPVVLLLGLVAGPALGVVLVADDFESGVLDPNVWQLVNGPDVAITPVDGQVFFNRPATQLNYLITAEQFDPAVTPVTITGSAVTGPEGLAIWTRAGAIGNTGGGPAHVLDSGIRIPLWPEGEASAWFDAEIIRKDPGVWGWTGIATENIPGAKAYDWDFVVTDDGATITATFTQSSDPTNTFTITATSTAHFDTNHIAFTVINGYLNEVTITTPDTVPFSLQAVGDIELGNDPQVGPDGRSNGSGLGARDIPDRRRVVLISYDISELKDRGGVSNVSLSNFSHDQHGEVSVYGVIEDLDLLDVESLTWNTAPGLMNDPTPELNSPVALDPNDLTEVLLSFSGPGQTGVRFSTENSAALADFINSDTDGIITLLIAPAAEGNQLIVRARTHAAGGTFLEGNVGPKATIIWVSDNKGFGDVEPNTPGDQGWVDLLTGQGYEVIYKNQNEFIDGQQYWRTLDPNKVAELEAADLIIMSRNGDSGSYSTVADNEPNLWNAVSTPLISLSAHMSRSNKWGWLNSTGTTLGKDAKVNVLDPNHAVFAGVAIDPNGQVAAYSDQWNMDWVTGATDAGNGTVLATRSTDGLVSIATWKAGEAYFDSGAAVAGGPRMLFIAGTGSKNSGDNYAPDGMYNLTADGEQTFLNAVAYMIAAAVPGRDALVAS